MLTECGQLVLDLRLVCTCECFSRLPLVDLAILDLVVREVAPASTHPAHIATAWNDHGVAELLRIVTPQPYTPPMK